MPIRTSLLAVFVAATVLVACGRTPLEGLPDVFVSDAVDVPRDQVIQPDAPPTGCRVNADCASTPATPVCDTSTGRCVECVTAPDSCPRGQICDGVVHLCVPGCRADSDCGGMNPRCRIETHQCVPCLSTRDCMGGATCINFVCVAPCRGGMCRPGTACCRDVCVNEQTDLNNCGGCGVVCGPVVRGTPGCASSVCGIAACDPGFADCDGNVSTGCETALTTDASNCGGCGVRCGAGQVCSGGVCATPNCTTAGCARGFTCCGTACTPTQTDPNNCGGCGVACNPIAHGAATCIAAGCAIAACDRDFADCDRIEMNGCETDLRSEQSNCGACGNVCAPGSACSAGTCVQLCGGGPTCPPGQQCCGVACAITSSDPNNCGGCGIPCRPGANATAACNSGSCAIGACTRGFGDCNRVVADGCEVNLLTDVANCGGCNVRCAAGSSCIAGSCVAPSGCPAVPCGANESCCSGTCRTVLNDPNNCGGCNVRCGVGSSCVGGSCTTTTGCPAVPCAANEGCCGGTCRIVQNDPNNCGGCDVRCPPSTPVCMGTACCTLPGPGGVCGAMVCPGTQTNCGGMCFDLATDLNNCGGCNIRCAAGQFCSGGFCMPPLCGGSTCGRGQTCCSNSCVNQATDPSNCGGCGIRCAAGDVCTAGLCTRPSGCPGGCPAGQTCCGTVCTNLATDTRNCGTCGLSCASAPNASAVCMAGACVLSCNVGFADCNMRFGDGCETALNTNSNCGSCGVACAAGSACTSGVCTVIGCNGGPPCTTGQTCCTSGCANLNADVSNCGRCGTVCNLPNATSTCTAGACQVATCNTGFANCNAGSIDGCEVNTQTDPTHCGSCSTVCGPGLTCTAGMCQPPSTGTEGAFFPTVNPTYLTPGVHNFTTITVPAGAMVYVAGAGPLAGTLDLRATGHIQIDGTIDVSGGPGSQAVVASSSTQQGHPGTGGYTGEVRSVAMPTAICEFATGGPGPNGPAVAGTSGSCTVVPPTACLSRSDPGVFIFAASPAQYGGGAGVFTGYRAYGSGGGGYAGGAGGALGAPFMGESDCSGVTAGGGATAGRGGRAMSTAVYDGGDGALGQTQCDGSAPGVSRAWVGGGAGGSIGRAAAADLAAASTFYAGSGGGGGSADYLQRPAFGGTSGGGGGGGVLRLWTPADIVVNGRLLANGGAGGDAYLGTPAGAGCDPQPGAAGGGGSGGLIYLTAPSITTGASSVVSTAGGRGGAGSVFATGGGGGTGGVGRIRVSVTPTSCALSGAFTPALASGCTPAAATPGRAYLAAYPN